MGDLLELVNIRKVYSRGLISRTSTVALSDVSLTLKEDEPTILTVAGESGSGKTTLAMLLLGFILPTSGRILYKGQDIGKLTGDERMIFRREVQAVFQDPFAVFNPFYTVDHLLSVPIRRFHLAKSRSDARDRMVEALTAVGLHPDDIPGTIPPPAFRRAEAAHQRGARPGPQAPAARGRRAGVHGRCVPPREHPGDAPRPPAGSWCLDHLHHARPDHRLPHLEVHHRALPGLGHGGRGHGHCHHPPAASLHAPSHRFHPVAGHQSPMGRDRDQGDGVRLLGSRPRVQVPLPLPLCKDKCRETPPLFRLGNQQAVSCYLHEKNPQIASERLSELLT